VADGFAVCLLGLLSLAQAEKVLPRHAEVYELEDGRLAAFVHVPAERVRPLIERLEARSYTVNFTSQPLWAAGLGA